MDERDARETRCEYEQDGGAYVLGALSAAERTAYERHLMVCPVCRETTAELAILPDLLARLDPARFPASSRFTSSNAAATAVSASSVTGSSSTASLPAAPSALSASALSAASLRSLVAWLRRPRGLVLAVASLVLIAGGAVGAVLLVGRASVLPPATTAPSSGRPVAMRPVDDDMPIAAQLTLVPSSPSVGTAGTGIDLVCVYGLSAHYPQAYPIRLMAYGPDGAAERVGAWVAMAGQRFVMSGVTRFPLEQLSRVELVGSDGTVLLAYDVP